MTQINKVSALNQLKADVAGLTVGTEDTETLLLLLKTCLNAGFRPDNIVTELESRISNITTSDTIFDFSYLVKSLELITENRSISVTSFSDLTAISNLGEGSIAFVEDEVELYILLSTNVWYRLTDIFEKKKEDNLYAWGGRNERGQLGDGTTIDRSSPVSVVGGFTDWVLVDTVKDHSLGLRANGTLWAWGRNSLGQLGDGTETNRSSPVLVVGGFTDWVSASAGRFNSLGLRSNGTLWAWGQNVFGELGDGTIINRSSPVSVVGGFTDWVSASTGGGCGFGIRANGTLWAWGNNTDYLLGDETTTWRSSPVSVVGGFTDWVSASGGLFHSLGLRANGTLWSWGAGYYSALGDGTKESRSSPVSVIGGFTDWVSASAGRYHNLGLRSNGTLWAWGYNTYGQLGDGTTIERSSPVSVVGGFTDWVFADAGRGFRSSHSLGVRANGTLWAWGYNGTYGQLGDGTTINRSSPVSVVGGFTDWVSASAGYRNSLGLRSG